GGGGESGGPAAKSTAPGPRFGSAASAAGAALRARARGWLSTILVACSAPASPPGGRPRTVTEALYPAGRPADGPLSCPAWSLSRRLPTRGGTTMTALAITTEDIAPAPGPRPPPPRTLT